MTGAKSTDSLVVEAVEVAVRQIRALSAAHRRFAASPARLTIEGVAERAKSQERAQAFGQCADALDRLLQLARDATPTRPPEDEP